LERVRHHGIFFAVQDFHGILAIIRQLRSNGLRPYKVILNEISARNRNVSLEVIRRSMELAVRLWLTLDTCSADIRVGPTSSEWPIRYLRCSRKALATSHHIRESPEEQPRKEQYECYLTQCLHTHTHTHTHIYVCFCNKNMILTISMRLCSFYTQLPCSPTIYHQYCVYYHKS
jgi:hypothetical protein